MSTAEDNAKIEAMKRQLELDEEKARRDPMPIDEQRALAAKMEASAPTVITPADPANEPETAEEKENP